MKRIVVFGLVMVVVAVAVAGYVSAGYGQALTATTATDIVYAGGAAGGYGDLCSVVVTGSEVVWFQKNLSTNDFVQSEGIPVTAGFPYTFKKGERIYSVCYATASGSSEFLIAFE